MFPVAGILEKNKSALIKFSLIRKEQEMNSRNIFERVFILIISVTALTMLLACTKLVENSAAPQLLQINYQYGYKDELNTFRGTYQKDLIMDGSIKIPFGLTADEQTMIIEKVLSINFFSFPDTIHRQAGVLVFPDHSPDLLRIKYENQDKTVVWYYPRDPDSEYSAKLAELTKLIRQIIEAKSEYKKLPAARGGYL